MPPPKALAPLVAVSRRCRVAVVGGGRIAQVAHLPFLAAHAQFELVALVEPFHALRETLSKRFRVEGLSAAGLVL